MMASHTPNHGNGMNGDAEDVTQNEQVPESATTQAEHDHDDELADEWGRESFPSSDPPGHY